MQTLILSLLLFVYHGYCQDASQYIIGGDAVKELGRWHSVCSLQYRWPNYGISHFCTSSILDKYWIITAAHCVINHPPNEYQVRCGSLSPNKQPGDKIQIREVKDIVIHEDYEYDYQAYPNDVALIHLAEPLDLSYEVWPSYVARKDNYDWSFSKCYSVGWGQTGKCWDANTYCKQWAADGHCTKHRADMEWQCPISCGMCKNAGDSDYLQEAQTWAFNYPGCSGKWSYNQINKNHICAYDYLNQLHGSCNGDSGGPFFCQRGEDYYQVGVFSYMDARCSPHRPSVYSFIGNFVDWIKAHAPGIELM